MCRSQVLIMGDHYLKKVTQFLVLILLIVVHLSQTVLTKEK